jgi:hypothetical protein
MFGSSSNKLSLHYVIFPATDTEIAVKKYMLYDIFLPPTLFLLYNKNDLEQTTLTCGL